jgi:hypothetical protein
LWLALPIVASSCRLRPQPTTRCKADSCKVTCRAWPVSKCGSTSPLRLTNRTPPSSARILVAQLGTQDRQDPTSFLESSLSSAPNHCKPCLTSGQGCACHLNVAILLLHKPTSRSCTLPVPSFSPCTRGGRLSLTVSGSPKAEERYKTHISTLASVCSSFLSSSSSQQQQQHQLRHRLFLFPEFFSHCASG